jgi:hypothetical protein
MARGRGDVMISIRVVDGRLIMVAGDSNVGGG